MDALIRSKSICIYSHWERPNKRLELTVSSAMKSGRREKSNETNLG